MSGYKIDIKNYNTKPAETYERVYRDRMLLQDKYNKYKKVTTYIILIGFLITAFLIVWFATSICFMTKLKEKNDELVEKQDKLLNENTDNLREYDKLLSEKDNEISQLRDRIIFLTFSQAVKDKVEVLSSEPTTTMTEELEQPENLDLVTQSYDFSLYTSLFSIGENVPLPDAWTNTYRCMDYRTITDKFSWQWKIQLKSQSDLISGLRYYTYNEEKYYTVALATAYGIDLGNAYEVELKNGTTFKIVHAEYKHDIRYPSPYDYGDYDKNYDDINTISVIEFIFDDQVAPPGLISDGEANRWLGDNCSIYGDGCNIVRMTYLGKIWHPKGE